MDLVNRLRDVKKRIRLSAERVKRDPEEIKLIPVSKFRSVEEMQVLIANGVKDFAENKVQELLKKQSILGREINWHLIGHLQRNKVKQLSLMPNLQLIHSVDSLRLAEEIEKRCQFAKRQMAILLQINVANDDAKFGLLPHQTWEVLIEVAKLERIKIKGLMTIVPEVKDPNEVRPYFRRLKDLSQELAEKIADQAISGVEMNELSMGMTNDFEVAIEEGATIVRVGSAIFGPRGY